MKHDIEKRLGILRDVFERRQAEAESKNPYAIVRMRTLTVDEWTVETRHPTGTPDRQIENMSSVEFMEWLNNIGSMAVYMDMLSNVEWFYILCGFTLPKERRCAEEWRTPGNLYDLIEEYPHLTQFDDPTFRERHSEFIQALSGLSQMGRIN